MFDGMTTLVDSLPFAVPARLRAGDTFTARELVTLAGGTVRIPHPRKLVHLQMRRYAGCPICNLHLRSFVRRKDDLDRAGIREVAVFHSSAEALRNVHAELPFDVVPDPRRQLYAALGVTTSPLALFHPYGLRALLRGAFSRAKYGVHADDQWSVDEVLALVHGAASSEVRA